MITTQLIYYLASTQRLGGGARWRLLLFFPLSCLPAEKEKRKVHRIHAKTTGSAPYLAAKEICTAVRMSAQNNNNYYRYDNVTHYYYYYYLSSLYDIFGVDERSRCPREGMADGRGRSDRGAHPSVRSRSRDRRDRRWSRARARVNGVPTTAARCRPRPRP